jgi:hypothetical protein
MLKNDTDLGLLQLLDEDSSMHRQFFAFPESGLGKGNQVSLRDAHLLCLSRLLLGDFREAARSLCTESGDIIPAVRIQHSMAWQCKTATLVSCNGPQPLLTRHKLGHVRPKLGHVRPKKYICTDTIHSPHIYNIHKIQYIHYTCTRTLKYCPSLALR